jgi:hypothetical protein
VEQASKRLQKSEIHHAFLGRSHCAANRAEQTFAAQKLEHVLNLKEGKNSPGMKDNGGIGRLTPVRATPLGAKLTSTGTETWEPRWLALRDPGRTEDAAAVKLARPEEMVEGAGDFGDESLHRILNAN